MTDDRIVAIVHTYCWSVSRPPAHVLEHVAEGRWTGGLDCFRCHVYRPLDEFVLLTADGLEAYGRGELRQEDLAAALIVDETNHEEDPPDDGEPPLTRVADVPPSPRGRKPKAGPDSAR